MNDALLLCTDLDRTLLPNGNQPESPEARRRFASFAARPQVRLAYVTGRHLALIEKAIANYVLPRPHFVIADVGTSLYESAAERVLFRLLVAIALRWGLNPNDLKLITALFVSRLIFDFATDVLRVSRLSIMWRRVQG